MSSWTGGAVFHIGSKEILHNPIMCSSVSLPLRLCPDPRGYPTTHTRLWWECGRARDVVSQLVKPLQMTAELEVEALRDILRDLVQLCHHITHDVATRTHDQRLMVFFTFRCSLGVFLSIRGRDRSAATQNIPESFQAPRRPPVQLISK
jgi:hypothetical protein